VRLGGECEGWYVAPGFYGEVVGFRKPGGHFVACEIGNAGEQLAETVVEGRGGRVEFVELFLERAGFVL